MAGGQVQGQGTALVYFIAKGFPRGAPRPAAATSRALRAFLFFLLFFFFFVILLLLLFFAHFTQLRCCIAATAAASCKRSRGRALHFLLRGPSLLCVQVCFIRRLRHNVQRLVLGLGWEKGAPHSAPTCAAAAAAAAAACA